MRAERTRKGRTWTGGNERKPGHGDNWRRNGTGRLDYLLKIGKIKNMYREGGKKYIELLG